MPPPAAGPKARNASAHSAKIDLRPLIGARMVAAKARALFGRSAVVLFRAARPGFAWPTRISSPTRKPRFTQAYAPASMEASFPRLEDWGQTHGSDPGS